MSNEEDTTAELERRILEESSRAHLDEICRQGARRMLIEVLENEVEEYIEAFQDVVDEEGKRKVVKNGTSHHERTIQTGAGPIKLKAPRVDDQREDEQFTSKIVPPYMRRSPGVEELIPALYLHGVSTGDMSEALEALLGPNASGLSATNIVRLKEHWEEDYERWSSRDLTGKRYVYFWADGLFLNVRLANERPCMLVVVGTLEDGTKELVALKAGMRENKLSWKELLLDLKKRGLKDPPKLIVADGGLGLWAAKPEVFPSAKEQLCWVHKKANVLNKLPKSVQSMAKDALSEIYMASEKEDALEAYDTFMKLFQAKYPKACQSLSDNKDRLLTFYEFPAEHWVHLRSTNPIESTFATVNHRHRQTKGCGNRTTTLTMAFKLARKAEQHWRRINGYQKIAKVLQDVEFRDGEEVQKEDSTDEIAA